MSKFSVPGELIPKAMIDDAVKQTTAMMPANLASAVNLMAHPLAGASAMTALGVGVASQAMGMWLGAMSGAAAVSQRLFMPMLEQAKKAPEGFRDVARTAEMRAGETASALIADAKAEVEQLPAVRAKPAEPRSKAEAKREAAPKEPKAKREAAPKEPKAKREAAPKEPKAKREAAPKEPKAKGEAAPKEPETKVASKRQKPAAKPVRASSHWAQAGSRRAGEARRASARPAAEAKKPTSRPAAKAIPADKMHEELAPKGSRKPASDRKPKTPDDLKAISGIGPKLEQVLNAEGIWTFEQIAGWSGNEVDRIEDIIGMKGRIIRDSWIPQAAKLAKTK
jgi:NADH-quinone oxidoreductase subunit E